MKCFQCSKFWKCLEATISRENFPNEYEKNLFHAEKETVFDKSVMEENCHIDHFKHKRHFLVWSFAGRRELFAQSSREILGTGERPGRTACAASPCRAIKNHSHQRARSRAASRAASEEESEAGRAAIDQSPGRTVRVSN